MSKRIRQFIGILLMALLLGFFAGVTASAAGIGLTFSNVDVYRTSSADFTVPATLEATVCFPVDMDDATRGGVIIGNFSGNKEGFNFEIHKNGNPRVYITDGNGKIHNIIFDEVDVYTGTKNHIVITVDWTVGTYQCYLNGQLKQTIVAQPFETFSFSGVLCLGGDLRSENTMYFRGTIENVALYKDMRTQQEIAEDVVTSKPDTDEMLLGYDLTSCSPDTYPKTVLSAIGPELNYSRLWLDRETVQNAEYAFALVGDIQTLNVRYPEQLPKIFDWLIENKNDKKIAHVFHLGDITDDDTDAEWERAKEQYNRLNDVIPYSFVRGNHDSVEKYNQYFSYAEYGQRVEGAQEENLLNTYQTITVAGVKYLLLNLDVKASEETYAWAGELIQSHPDHNVIVTTHIYLARNGNRITSLKYGASNTAEDLWQKFISQYENIVMVFCGHASTDQIVVKKEKGIHGNEVTQILVDPQTTDKTYSATGLVALLHFSEGGKHVEVEYYSTVKEKHFLDTNQFGFDVMVVEETHQEPEIAPVMEETIQEADAELTAEEETVENSESVFISIKEVVSADVEYIAGLLKIMVAVTVPVLLVITLLVSLVKHRHKK